MGKRIEQTETERNGDAGTRRRGEGDRFDLSVVNHNRDLNSKAEKIDGKSRMSIPFGLELTVSPFLNCQWSAVNLNAEHLTAGLERPTNDLE